MPAPATTFELLDHIVALGLCDSTKLVEKFPPDRPLPDTPAELVKLLVQEGICTRYQGKALLAGKGRRLVFGKYRLLKPLGRGGMGSVYLGRHTTLRRQVAVKVLRDELTRDPLATARFEREARAAAALDHPNVVKLFDFGVSSSGLPYLVLEFVPGVTAQHLIDTDGAMGVPSAVFLVTAIASALAHAHARGFVHRDIKPLNVMVSPDGGVKLLDMGLARALDSGDDRLTEKASDTTISGTIDYLSPEQCWGSAVDGRTDVYSLGATLFTLLTGRPPFSGTPAEKIAQHQAAPPPPADRVSPIIPTELARVIERMMAKQPADRYPTCLAVVQALAPWCPLTPPALNDQQTTNIRRVLKSSKEWSAGEQATKPRRWRWVAVLVTFLALVGVAVAVTLACVSPATVPHAEPRWAGSPVELVGATEIVNDIAFTPDGRQVVGVDFGGWVHTWDARTGELVRSVSLGHGQTCAISCAFTPDGHLLVGGESATVLRISPESGRVVDQFEAADRRVWGFCPTRDGKAVLVASEKSVHLRALPDGELIRDYRAGFHFVWCAIFSPDQSLVAAGGQESDGNGLIRVWEAETGHERFALRGHTQDVRSVAFSMDGRVLYSVGFDGDLRVWDLTTGKCVKTMTMPDATVERVIPLPGGRVLTADGHRDRVTGLTRTVRMWDVNTGEEVMGGPAADNSHYVGLALSPDGRQIVASAKSRVIRLWEFRPPNR